jgi:hypothetical protein
MAYEILNWIFDDSLKFDSDYQGIMVRPYRKFQDVSEQLQRLREQGNAKGDRRLDSFLSKVDVFQRSDPFDISGEIENQNESWSQELLRQIEAAQNEDDIGTIRQTFESQRNNYEDSTAQEVENRIIERETALPGSQSAQELERVIRSATQEEQLGVLPSMAEVKRRYGEEARKRVSEQLAEKLDQFDSLEEKMEKQIRSQIQSATTDADLDRIDISSVPTVRGENILRGEIEDKREELS